MKVALAVTAVFTAVGAVGAVIGATVGDLCEIGNGAILMPGARLGGGVILGEGTLIPPHTTVPSNAVVVGTFLLRACVVNFRTSLEDIEALPILVTRTGKEVDAAMRTTRLNS